jgi:hypothetical protein
LLEAQAANDYNPQVVQASKVALALPLISDRTESGEPAPTPPVAKPAPTPTPPPQEAERPQQEAASQQVRQSAASKCTGDQIEKMINAGFSKEEIVRLCEATTESPAKGTLSKEEVVAPVPVAQSQIMTLDELNAFAANQAKAYKVILNGTDSNQGLEYKKLLRAPKDYLGRIVLVRGVIYDTKGGSPYDYLFMSPQPEQQRFHLLGLTPQSPVHKLHADDFLIIGTVAPGTPGSLGTDAGINIYLICGIISDAPSKRAEVRCDSVKKP